MQLYDSFGPNPRAMRMFLAEKNLKIPTKEIDLLKAENRKPLFHVQKGGEQYLCAERKCAQA